jgi:hypothetical protein
MNLLEKIRRSRLYEKGLISFKELTLPARKIDNDDNQWTSLGKRPDRDLPPQTQDYVSNLAYRHWLLDPLGGRVIEIISDFIIGEGAQVTSPNENVQAVIDEFWEDEVNDFPEEQIAICTEMSIFGELLLIPFVKPVSGLVQLARIDALWIKDILPVPQFPQKAGTVVLKNDNVVDKTGLARRELKIIRPSQDPRSPIPGMLDGDCFYFAWGKVAGKRRGHSQLMRVIEWLDIHNKRLFNEAENQELSKAFVWDVTLKGASQEQIKDFLEKTETPQNASIRAHSDDIEWNAVAPDLKAQDFSESQRNFLQIILGAFGIPEHFYALGREVNFATAKAMSEPTQRAFKRQQRTIKRVFERLIDYQLERAKMAGRLSEAEIAEGYEIQMDEISTVDLQNMSAALVSIAATLQTAEAQGWIEKDDAADAFAQLFGQTGTEVEAVQGEKVPDAMKTAAQAFAQAFEARRKKKIKDYGRSY